MTSLSIARVPTASASRYLQQLAKHWSHKFDVSFSEEEGHVAFSDVAALALRADSQTLDLELTTPDADAERMRKVVEEHIDRFAFREAPLTYDWSSRDA